MKKLKKHSFKQNALAAIRRKHGYTQEEFAQLLGIPKSTLSMAEGRYRLLPISALMKLSSFEKEMKEQHPQEPPAATP